jgi:hypothetical protein
LVKKKPLSNEKGCKGYTIGVCLPSHVGKGIMTIIAIIISDMFCIAVNKKKPLL